MSPTPGLPVLFIVVLGLSLAGVSDGASFEEGDVECGSYSPPPPALRAGCDTLRLTTRVLPLKCRTGKEPEPHNILPLVITSTGHSGTMYTSKRLRRAGYWAVHDGAAPSNHTFAVVSWVTGVQEHFVRAARYPFFSPHAPHTKFRQLFHQVRSPLLSIAARTRGPQTTMIQLLMQAVGPEPWHHIRDGSKVHIFQNVLRHWVSWHEFLYSVADYGFRVEDLPDPDAFAEVLTRAWPYGDGVIPDLYKRDDGGDGQDPVSHATHHVDHVNITWPELCDIDHHFCLRAARLSRWFGYCVPAELGKEVDATPLPFFRPTLEHFTKIQALLDQLPFGQWDSHVENGGVYPVFRDALEAGEFDVPLSLNVENPDRVT